MKKPRLAPARYPIRAVSQLTGIGIDTLRAWERRHAAVTPSRDARGRVYSDDDVARLRLLRSAVAHGHSIGRLAGISNDELRRLADTAEQEAPPAPDPVSAASLDTGALAAALREYDAAGIEQEIARLAAVLPPLNLLQDVMMPALVKVGDDWHRGRASIAQEHLLSAAIRNILGSFLRLYRSPDAPARLLFATPSGERHELGTLGAAMLAASSGLGVTYLGPDLPAREIVGSVNRGAANVVVVGLSTSPGTSRARELRTLVRDLSPKVELWAGGRGAERHAALITPRGLILNDYQSYQQELVRLGGRIR